MTSQFLSKILEFYRNSECLFFFQKPFIKHLFKIVILQIQVHN